MTMTKLKDDGYDRGEGSKMMIQLIEMMRAFFLNKYSTTEWLCNNSFSTSTHLALVYQVSIAKQLKISLKK